MLKKLLALSLISIALVGCGNSKEAVFDKCLKQANETFSKEDAIAKSSYIRACMTEHGYKWAEKSTEEICPLVFLNSNCYK